MLSRRLTAALLLLTCPACTPPPEAPEELEDLARFVYREWGHDDPSVMASGVANLEAFIEGIDLAARVNDRAWELPALTEEDRAAVAHPDRPAEALVGVSVAYASPWPVEDHARLQSEADQLPTEPTATFYERSFPQLDDSACFPGHTCDVMVSLNNARRQNFLMSVEFLLMKDFRWVELADDRHAVVARSWFEQSWPGDDGNTHLWQSHAVDVWIGRPDGTTWRFQGLWSESELGISASAGAIAATVRGATDAIYQAGDAAIGELYHPDDETQ